jgi:hypothetical protein
VVTLLQMDGKLWSEARDSLAGVAELSRLKGGEGLDIFCLNNPNYRLDLRVSSLFSFTLNESHSLQNELEVYNFFNDIVPEGNPLRPFACSLLTPL